MRNAMRGVAPHGDSLCDNVLLCLIPVLNTLVRSVWPHGQRKGGARLRVAHSNSD